MGGCNGIVALLPLAGVLRVMDGHGRTIEAGILGSVGHGLGKWLLLHLRNRTA